MAIETCGLWKSKVNPNRDLFLASSFDESMPFLSPDGRYVAYESERTGKSEIFVTTFPDPSREWQVSTDGGSTPNGDQIEVFYMN